MSTKSQTWIGWILIAVALLIGVTTVPVWNVSGRTANGSVTVNSNPLRTTVDGQGEVHHEAFWSVSWPMTLVSAAVLAGGVVLLRSRRLDPPAVASA